MSKKLYRSRTNKVVAGIFGGIGEMINVDPVILRLIWILIVVFTAVVPGIIAYILAMVVVPSRPYEEKITDDSSEGAQKKD